MGEDVGGGWGGVGRVVDDRERINTGSTPAGWGGRSNVGFGGIDIDKARLRKGGRVCMGPSSDNGAVKITTFGEIWPLHKLVTFTAAFCFVIEK